MPPEEPAFQWIEEAPIAPTAPDVTPTRSSNKRPAPRGSASYPRKRAVTACQVCRARRTKCDNAKPACSFCVSVGAKCVQSPVDMSSFDPASLRILERLDELEQLMRGKTTSIERQNTDRLTPLAINEPLPTEEEKDSATVLPYSIERMLSQWPELRTDDDLDPGQPNPFLHSRKSGLDTPKPSPQAPDGVNAIGHDQCNLLVESYCSNVAVFCPILHHKEAHDLVFRLCTHGVGCSAETCLALLICALGTISAPFDDITFVWRDSNVYDSAEKFFCAAKQRLGIIMGTSTLMEAQCMFLSGLYMLYIFKRHEAWRFFSQALASCQTFNHIRNLEPVPWPDKYGSTNRGDSLESEEQKGRRISEETVYWFALKFERELRSDLDLPDFTFSEWKMAPFPSRFLTGLPFADLDDTLESTGDREHSACSFLTSEISFFQLVSRIVGKILALKRNSSKLFLESLAILVPEHEANVREWESTLPKTLNLQLTAREDDISRFILRNHLLDLHETIYWPFVDAAIHHPRDQPPLNPLIRDLASKGLQNHLARFQVNRAGWRHRNHETVRFWRNCVRSALVLMAAALVAKQCKADGVPAPVDVPVGWQNAAVSMILLGRYWDGESEENWRISRSVEVLWGKVERFRV